MTDAHRQEPPSVLPVESPPLLEEVFGRDQVTDLRHTVAAYAQVSGLHGQRLDDFVLAAHELITNAVRHGGGNGRLRLWSDGQNLLCEVADCGTGISPERLGNRDRPAPDSVGGWGLWLAGELSDDMVVETGPHGTTVRIKATVDGATTLRQVPPTSAT
jgi:anti-sigma regulatory factor (Ser/Thr protein kinase)